MSPPYLSKLRVKGYKTFADTTIDLEGCNVLIGGNGAGKSTFLSVLKMLRALVHGELELFVERAGRANDVLRRSTPPTRELEIDVDLRTGLAASRYHMLAERTEDNRLLIRSEETEQCDSNGESLGPTGHTNRLRESMLASRLAGEQFLFSPMQLFGGLRSFHFSESAHAAPASYDGDADDHRELRENGSNLAAYLFFLQRHQQGAYRRIVANVRQVLADFGDFVLQPITYDPQSPQRIRLRWRMKGIEGDLGAHQFSDGTLRFILLTTLLGQPPELLPKIITIDEPELGLHPSALNLVVSLLRVASRHCQIIVATQSAALVDCFRPDEVVVVRRQQGASTMERLSEESLREWLADYTLGELWEKNVFGGGPFG